MFAPSLHSFRSALVGASLFLIGTASALAQGSPIEGVYKPLSGKCRVASSFGGPGPLVQNIDRLINVTNAASYASQGGTGNLLGGNSSAGCGIPNRVSALVISTSVLPIGSAGTFKIFEAGKSLFDGNSVAFNTVDAVTNDMIVPARTTDTAAEITINSSRATNYILDVVGYFTIPTAPELVCVDSAPSTTTVLAGTARALFPFSCEEGYTQSAMLCESSSADMPLYAQTLTNCTARNNGASSATLTAFRRCCRVQGVGF
jgi:hypothetical protein